MIFIYYEYIGKAIFGFFFKNFLNDLERNAHEINIK